MSKFLNKSQIIYLLIFVSFISLSIFINIYSYSLIDLEMYYFNNIKTLSINYIFSMFWILCMLFFIYIIPSRKKIIIYDIVSIVWNIVFIVQFCFAQQFGKYMIFSDFLLTGEGIKYFYTVLYNINPLMIIGTVLNILFIIAINLLSKNHEFNKASRKNIIIIIIIILITRVGAILSLGKDNNTNDWWENYNKKNIYINMGNQNNSMFICGFYEYNLRSMYKFFLELIVDEKVYYMEQIDDYNEKYDYNVEENNYTGIFKDKNVVYILMESIDSWIIDEETMPTLSSLMNKGWNFTNRYSPFFNGGQTINSEFSLNTGMYAIITRNTIYDIKDVDYKYSLANMLKQNNYSVNSYHANKSSFYNRGEFHKLLGYDNHYSFSDLQSVSYLENDKNYLIDSVSMSDEKILELMFKREKSFTFFTTYSAHLSYDKNNDIYLSLDEKIDSKELEEENIYRTLAHDTDKALKELIDYLEQKKLIDNTVLVLATDHYSYGYSNQLYVSEQKKVDNNKNSLQKTPFIIWSKNIKHKEIDTIMDTADILPTMLNLLGINYKSYYYMGTDVFSNNHDEFVWFYDNTYIKSNTCSMTDDEIKNKTLANIYKNKYILNTNYYGGDINE